MKQEHETGTRNSKTVIIGLALSFALAVPIHAQADQSMTMPGNSGPMAMGGMMQMEANMKAMQADMKAMDDELDTLVVRMNQASGSEKTTRWWQLSQRWRSSAG